MQDKQILGTVYRNPVDSYNPVLSTNKDKKLTFLLCVEEKFQLFDDKLWWRAGYFMTDHFLAYQVVAWLGRLGVYS